MSGVGRLVRKGLVGTWSKKISAAVSLAYDPVILIGGDSQARGSADDSAAAIAAYVADPKVLVANFAGGWSQYAPGTITGVNFGANVPDIGAELSFIRKARAAYPSNTIRIIKVGNSGSFMSRGLTNGTVTGSIGPASNIMAMTAGNPIPNNSLLRGRTSIDPGLYAPFSAGGANEYVALCGVAAAPSLTVASQIFDRFPFGNSWSVTEGGLYQGFSNSITNGARAFILTALAAIGTSYRIVNATIFLGSNDMSSNASGTLYQVAYQDFLNKLKADLPLTQAIIACMRVRTGSTASATVRTAQAAVVAATPTSMLIDTDSYTLSGDNFHYNTAGLDAAGVASFNATVF